MTKKKENRRRRKKTSRKMRVVLLISHKCKSCKNKGLRERLKVFIINLIKRQYRKAPLGMRGSLIDV